MNLNNLPKDMLVELVSQIQESKEEEYSEYIVIPYDNTDDSKFFRNEKDLKLFLLDYISEFDSCFPSKEANEKFKYMTITELKKSLYSLLEKYSKEDLFELVEKMREKNVYYGLHIIKGKTISN